MSMTDSMVLIELRIDSHELLQDDREELNDAYDLVESKQSYI
jgi:uncharacterized protein YfkK (UPF0435 family)